MAEEQKDPKAGDPIDEDEEDEEEEEEEEEETGQLPEDPGPENPEASVVPENPPEPAVPPPAPDPEPSGAVAVVSDIRPASFAESFVSSTPTTGEGQSAPAATPETNLETLSVSAEDLPEPPQPDPAAQGALPLEDETPPPQDETVELTNLDGDKIEFLDSPSEQAQVPLENDQASIPESDPGEIENGQLQQPPDEAEGSQPELPPDEVDGGQSDLPLDDVDGGQPYPPLDEAEGGQPEPPLDEAEGVELEPPTDDANDEGNAGEGRSIENGDADVGTTEGAMEGEGSENSYGAAETEPTGEGPLSGEDVDAVPDANIEAVSEVLGTPKEIGSVKGSQTDIFNLEDEAASGQAEGDGMNEEELNDEQEGSDQAEQNQELPNDELNQVPPGQEEIPPKAPQAAAPPPAAPAIASCEPREPVSDVQSYLDPILGYDRYPCNLCNNSEDDEDPFAASIQFAYELFGQLVELVMSKLSQNNNPQEQ